tara:strand:- start:100 stop:507 length:408 start_codon:yes stop_codon:yes gene_type:complete
MKKFYENEEEKRMNEAAYRRVRTLTNKFPGYAIGLGYEIRYYDDEYMPEKYVYVNFDWEEFINWVCKGDTQHPAYKDAKRVSQEYNYDDRWGFCWTTVEDMMIRIQDFAKKWYGYKQEWDRKYNGCVSETSRLDK